MLVGPRLIDLAGGWAFGRRSSSCAMFNLALTARRAQIAHHQRNSAVTVSDVGCPVFPKALVSNDADRSCLSTRGCLQRLVRH